MANLKYNIVLCFCKIHFYLKVIVTNFDVLPNSEIGTWYILCKALCPSPVT
jgi:hypothetical protein